MAVQTVIAKILVEAADDAPDGEGEEVVKELLAANDRIVLVTLHRDEVVYER